MPKIGFTAEMLDTLRSMEGKTFKSYECLRDMHGGVYTTFGNFRINLGRSSVDFSCYLERVEDYVGGPEDIATFVGEPNAGDLGITPLDVLWEEDELIAADATRELVRL